MSYRIDIHPDLESALKKLRIKDPKRYEQLKKKIYSLIENPQSGKPLTGSLKGKWRAHVGSFVLFYSIIDSEKKLFS
jgi:addiction module RelE/StbE family toxin